MLVMENVKIKENYEYGKEGNKIFQPIYGQVKLRKDELLQNYPSIKKQKNP